MDEDPEIPEIEAEERGEEAPRMPAGAVITVVAAGVIAVGLAIYFGIAQTIGGLFLVIGIPLVLLWFVWNVFLRRLWRIRGMRAAQDRRELMEAALRDKKTNHKEQ